jgi:hypothetical protein
MTAVHDGYVVESRTDRRHGDSWDLKVRSDGIDIVDCNASIADLNVLQYAVTTVLESIVDDAFCGVVRVKHYSTPIADSHRSTHDTYIFRMLTSVVIPIARSLTVKQ